MPFKAEEASAALLFFFHHFLWSVSQEGAPWATTWILNQSRHGVPSSRNKNVESISVSKWKSNSSSLLKIYASTFPIDMSEVVQMKPLGIIQTIKNLRCLEWSFSKIKKARRKWEKGVAKACYNRDCHVSSFSSFWDPLLKSRHFQWNCRENFNTHWRLYRYKTHFVTFPITMAPLWQREASLHPPCLSSMILLSSDIF